MGMGFAELSGPPSDPMGWYGEYGVQVFFGLGVLLLSRSVI